jgi:hypothetical protein
VAGSLAVVITVAVAAIVVFALRVPLSSDAMRRAVVQALAERLDADVELAQFELHFFPRITASGSNLIVRHQGRRDVPPLISVERFVVRADLAGLWRRRVAHVRLEGLAIQIPPRRETQPGSSPRPQNDGAGHDVVVNELVAQEARLVLVPRDSLKPPKIWYIRTLRMESVSADTAMPFTAELTNAVPPGQIETAGTFGPWNREAPGDTSLGGSFTFANANLGVFKGISGTLSSMGGFGGTLGHLEVQGETSTPDFTVAVGGLPVPLTTRYNAIVDGTNGDTRLERVDAMLAETSIVAVGDVAHVEGVKGRLITLDVTIDQGRIEDVLRLAVNTPQPPMTGALGLETSLVLPPGDEDVASKLSLDGVFTIDDGRFTDPAVQRQINELSVRARGRRAAGTTPPGVTSDFSGTFVLEEGTLRLSQVTFDVPGAIVELSGQYALEPETLAFSGSLFMDARVSETASGFKRLLLKVVDPLFRKGGRTVVPLRVSGTRSAPAFGLDVRRVFSR